MKKELKNKLIFISGVVFAFALLGGVVVVAQAVTNSWTPPTQNFPQANVYPPIDTGPGEQTKDGSLILKGDNQIGAVVKIQTNQSFAVDNSPDAGYFTPSYAELGAIINSAKSLLINTKGLVLPRTGTGAPIESPLEGTIYYKTADKKVQLWNGTAWTDLGGGGGTPSSQATSMKICRVYVPNNWSDTINVPSTWTANSCNSYGGLQKATRYVLGCFDGDSYRFGSDGQVGNYPVSASFPSPDCGWKQSSGAYFKIDENPNGSYKTLPYNPNNQNDREKYNKNKMFCDYNLEEANDCSKPIIYPTQDQIKQQENILGYSLTSVTKGLMNVFCAGYGGGGEDCTEYKYYTYTFNP